MRRIAVACLIVLVAFGCGSSTGPWKENIVTASQQIAETDPDALFGDLTTDSAAEAKVDEYCASPDDPGYFDGLNYVYAALVPLDLRAALTRSGVSEDTIKKLYEGLDGGMDEKCSDAKEEIFSWVPYSGWTDSLRCNIDENFAMADSDDALVTEACS